MREITRSDCGFAIFNQCDPATCQCDCFTARAIAINEKYRPQPILTRRSTRVLSVFAATIAVALVAFSMPETIHRVNVANQEAPR